MFIDGLRLSSFAVFRYGMDESGISDGSDIEFLISLGENYEVDSFPICYPIEDTGFKPNRSMRLPDLAIPIVRLFTINSTITISRPNSYAIVCTRTAVYCINREITQISIWSDKIFAGATMNFIYSETSSYVVISKAA